jgi:YggT family protein
MPEFERETVQQSTTESYPAGPARDVRTTERIRTGPTGGEVIRRFVMLLFGVLQALLLLRIVLLLLVANPGNDVVSLVLGVTDPFVDPFRGMFQLDEVSADRSTLDVAAIVALIAWTLVEALVIAALSLGASRGEDATA